MFMGTYYNSIDAKGRMTVPSRYREELGEGCVITRGIDQCLNIYSFKDWQKQVDRMMQLPESSREVRAFIRHCCSNAVECEFDRQGRIRIPDVLLDYAVIEKELVTLGAMSKIEIWGRENWEAPDNPGKMDAEEFAETLEKFNF